MYLHDEPQICRIRNGLKGLLIKFQKNLRWVNFFAL
jgi:hypothetical protein